MRGGLFQQGRVRRRALAAAACGLWLALGGPGRLAAADAAAEFSAANELYAKGKFAEAAAAYEQMRQREGESAALLFNCGNAEFKAGHLGKAIAAYRQAELLTPRDAELRANLAYVRSQVAGGGGQESRWQSWVGTLTLNEGTLAAAGCGWLLLGLLAARQVRPALAPKLRTATRVAAVLTLGSGSVLALQTANHFHTAVAVVTAAEASARSGPFDDAQSSFTVRDGAELRVLDRHDGWVQVAGAGGKIGWLSAAQAEVMPGA